MERQHAEVVAPRRERQLERRVAWRRFAGAEDVATRGDEDAARSIRGLDGHVHDHPEQLVDVVRRRERLAETRDRPAEPSPLGLELRHSQLELVGHLVERRPERRELVTSADRHPLRGLAVGDRACGVREAAEREHDRPALEIGDERDERGRSEQTEEELVSRGGIGRVDP